jgi:hypothetical protein
MSDLGEYVVGVVPMWFQAQLCEKTYIVGESIEFPRMFAEDTVIVKYVEERGWAIEYSAKRGKPHRLVKERAVEKNMGAIGFMGTVEAVEEHEPVVYVPEVKNPFPDVDLMRDLPYLQAEELERQERYERAFRNYELWHREAEREMLESERQKIIRRGRLDTFDEMRLEELDELLGPVVIPERELVDYW